MSNPVDTPPPGIHGTLVSSWYASHRLASDFASQLGTASRSRARRELAAWWRQDGVRLGPASSLRMLFDAGLVPVLDTLGFRVDPSKSARDSGVVFGTARAASLEVPVAATVWGSALERRFCQMVGRGNARSGRWAIVFNGRSLRLWDAFKGWSRAFLEFDLETVIGDDTPFAVFWALARADALASSTADVALASERHGSSVRASLREGVREAVEVLSRDLAAAGARRGARGSGAGAASPYAQALTLVYRLLFLLFAESRGLVPTWHPVYRRSYSTESLRSLAERHGAHAGLWESLQAVWRMAHAGCQAGDLVVTPFNGRLFSPRQAPLADSVRLDDDRVAKAIVSITTAPGPRGRERIAFADLGVEQLGAVYESVLDHEPATCGAAGIRRKSSGTFYTPREMTDYLVRQALEPLVADRTPEQILALRVLDPAMGSGAFLVAACHFLAAAYERALERHLGLFPGDTTDAERARYRRLIAQHCLYGIDINPMAVQVARLSLWLATLAADKPLTFLDHHVGVGNSLVGATLDDVARRPPGGRGRRRPETALPLFPPDDAGPALTRVLPLRRRLAAVPDDSVAAVRDKESALSLLRDDAGELGVWRRLADLWCAGWFWSPSGGAPPTVGAFADLAGAILGHRASMPPSVVGASLAHVRVTARDVGFFHWTLEFPEVFYDEGGTPRADGGFDAVVTNPPWEMVRADTGGAEKRLADRAGLRQLVAFVRGSGLYPACGEGQANLYQLFVERCLRLTRPGGRIGLIVPWGLASDHGSAALRAHLMDRCDVDRLVAFENNRGIFPIHRGVRFLLLSASPGPVTTEVRCRFGMRDPAALDELDAVSAGAGPDRDGICLTPALLTRLAGPARAFPYVRSAHDIRLLDRLARQFPALASEAGWHAAFGRELNATEDRPLMTDAGEGLPVVEGKHIEPFRLNTAGCRRLPIARVPSKDLLHAARRWRLAYRDVASSTNRLTLIAALVPPQHVTVHTAFCLKSASNLAEQAFLCGVLNSLVANYAVRMWVTTHVSSTIVGRIPVPRPPAGSAAFVTVASLALALRERGPHWEAQYARLQGTVAHLYGLSRDDYVHVVGTFPLIDAEVKRACLAEWDGLARRR